MPSYSESLDLIAKVRAGVDLLAAIYRGLLSYASLQELKGNKAKAKEYTAKAQPYQQIIDKQWWDATQSLYNTYYTSDGEFGKQEGEGFLLWFDALKDTSRKRKTLEHLAAGKWNVENQSYFPIYMYQNGYPDKGYDYILHLTDPKTERWEYPEVTFGAIKGIVEGLMGVEPDARYNRISTLYRGQPKIVTSLNDLPVFNTTVTITHTGMQSSSFRNNGNKPIMWRAKFKGNLPYLFRNQKAIKTAQESDSMGNVVSYVDVIVRPAEEIWLAITRNTSIQ